MVTAANLGFPRIGAKRELKKAVEGYWKGNLSAEELQAEAKSLRKIHWDLQKDAGLDKIPSNDFSFYDQVLDMICTVGAVPERYGFKGENIDLETYFAMARGCQKDGKDVTAMEMTKWFDTNYHFIVPELTADTKFKLSSTKAVDEFNEAKELGIETRPVLVGPITFLLLSKLRDDSPALALLDSLLEVYVELINKLEAAGATEIQIDEPCLVLDLDDAAHAALKTAFTKIAESTNVKLTLATYFGALEDNLETAFSLPVATIHVDLVRGGAQLDAVLDAAGDKNISLGLVNGRNIWKTDFNKAIAVAEKAVAKLGSEKIEIAPSCSLLHSPVDLDSEEVMDSEIKNWMAFAKQKLAEIKVIATAVSEGKDSVGSELAANAAAWESRGTSSKVHNDAVKQRAAAVSDDMMSRKSPYAERSPIQRSKLHLPLLPTTTIGSFPQTTEVRQARAKFKKGAITREEYDTFLEEETIRTIRIQEDLGLDVLVHGEFERNDMVEYFGEKLEGFVFSKFGWVQSYGSRCVKPPIIFGDVSREEAMTVRWITFAQGNTENFMKGMLTGPVTILQWSFVRDDQPRSETCKQIGLAIRDEVLDLEKAGIQIIQIDEAALREGLPLRRKDWGGYLKWAVDSFRLTASGAKDETQIHTHMCYSEFNDIIESIADMDADVISIETSRSQMELLDAFVDFKYPNEIGPGVYDIHSPRVPSQDEIENLLKKALAVLAPEQLWVNPDCGLKTRGWPEVKLALEVMVNATKNIREDLEANGQAA
jgi:5-methyltetrahydropteroyltriglutamate--homocysteine methyltransferase